MDFDNPAAALKAVHALKTSGIQAQMAKVSLLQACVRVCVCVGGHVCVSVFALPTNISDGLRLFIACTCAIRVRRMTLDWSHDPSSQAVLPVTPFIFQMSCFPLPNNLSFSGPCYLADHHLAHSHTSRFTQTDNTGLLQCHVCIWALW